MKLTLALICLIFAASLARDVTFKGTTCTDTGGTNKLANTKGEKIKIMTEKDHACGDVAASIQIEKGDMDFYVKASKYDQDKTGGQAYFTASVTGTNVVSSKNEKIQVATRSLRSQKGVTMKGLAATGTVIVTIQGSAGRKELKKGVKVTVTVGRGSFTDIGPILFWVFFVIIVITCILLLAAAIVLTILVVKKLKN